MNGEAVTPEASKEADRAIDLQPAIVSRVQIIHQVKVRGG
jgi:hypothetical protein